MYQVNILYLYLTFVSTYVGTSILCFLHDYFFFNKKNKIQFDNKNDVISTYKKAFWVCFQNVFLYIPLFILGSIYYSDIFSHKFSFGHGNSLFFDLYDIPKFITNFFLVDIFFYSFHRIFHFPLLYNLFHKKHHEFKKPVSITALYNTPIDCFFSNMLPILLPIIILDEGTLISHLWIITATVDTIWISHFGRKNWSEFHDLHHEKFKYNYGTEVFMDRLFGTLYVAN